jgi:hypothetical protein
MRDSEHSMIGTGIIGVGAGLASALLFASPIGGTFLALPLFILSGLPVAIAGLGWGSLAAGIAALAAAVAVAAALSPIAAAIHLALFGAPLVWACRLAALSRIDEASAATEWYPLGRLLLQLAAATAAGLIVVGVVIGYDPESFTAEITHALAAWLAAAPDAGMPPQPEELEPFVRINVVALPFTTASLLVIILVFTLWLAARIAEASGRMARPRERVWTAFLPGEAALAFAVSLGASFVPGALGLAAGAATGALGGAFALIGLAVLHAATIGNPLRILILVSVYVVLVFFGGLPLILLAVLGIAETFLHIRARRFRGAPPAT